VAGRHQYVVEVLEHNEYPAEELSMYLNEVSEMQKLRLISAFPTTTGMLTLIWELE